MPTNAINDTGVKYLYDKLHGEIEPIAEAVSDSEVTIEGNPLSFNTLSSQNAKSTILSLEPIQDLHGYDKPWVGGKGKNIVGLTLADITSLNTAGTWNNGIYTLNNRTFEPLFTEDGYLKAVKVNTIGSTSAGTWFYLSTNIPITSGQNYTVSGVPLGSSGMELRVGASNDSWVASDTGDGGSYNSWTATENICRLRITITAAASLSNAIISPMICLSSAQNPTTFEPYSNLCPITGRTEIGILGCGKNLFDVSTVTNNFLNKTNGTVIPNDSWRTSDYILFSGNKATWTWNSDSAYFQVVMCVYDINKTFISGFSRESTNLYTFTFDIPQNAVYLRFGYSVSVSSSPVSRTNIRLNNGESDLGYSPYTKSNDLTISFGQTVYGGQVDVENGVLVVDYAYKILTSSDILSVSAGSSIDNMGGKRINTTIFDAKYCGTYFELSNIISNCLETVSAGKIYNQSPPAFCCSINDANQITFRANGADTVAKAQTYVTDNEVQVVYELAETITINLTPNTINLLKGVNNINTDGDKITLTYRDGSVATLGDLTSAVDNLDSKIDESKILTDTATGDKYILVVTNGVLSVEQVSN